MRLVFVEGRRKVATHLPKPIPPQIRLKPLRSPCIPRKQPTSPSPSKLTLIPAQLRVSPSSAVISTAEDSGVGKGVEAGVAGAGGH